MSKTRDSTLRHLKHLVAAAAVLSCDKDEQKIEKDRSLDASQDATVDAADANVADASVPVDASDASVADVSIADAGADGKAAMKTPPACPPGSRRRPDGTCGYMVVDPVPRPSRSTLDY
jgi:hypothetical protein